MRLTLELAPAAVIRTAYRMGIVSQLQPNASIALGTSEVSLYELVSAYTPFANGGYADSPHVIQRIRTADGKLLYTRAPQALGQIVDRHYVAMMNTMMRQTLAAGTARAASLPGWRRPERPAPARITATPGSSVTPRDWLPASGSAMTTPRRPARRPAAACRSRSGAGS